MERQTLADWILTLPILLESGITRLEERDTKRAERANVERSINLPIKREAGECGGVAFKKYLQQAVFNNDYRHQGPRRGARWAGVVTWYQCNASPSSVV